MGLFDGVRGASRPHRRERRHRRPLRLAGRSRAGRAGQSQSAAAVALGCARYDPRIAIAGVVLNQVASERHRRLVDGRARPRRTARRRRADARSADRAAGAPSRSRPGRRDARTRSAPRSARRSRRALGRPRPDRRPAATSLRDAPESRAGAAAAGPAHRARPRRCVLLRLSAHARRLAQGRRQDRAVFAPRRRSTAGAIAIPAGCRAAIRSCTRRASPPRHAFSAACAPSRRAAGARRMRRLHGARPHPRQMPKAARHAMAGLLAVATSFAKRKLHLGYRVAHLLTDCPLGPAGARLVGHEFHYASTVAEEPPNLAAVTDAAGADLGPAGHRSGLVTGTFFHVLAQRTEP